MRKPLLNLQMKEGDYIQEEDIASLHQHGLIRTVAGDHGVKVRPDLGRLDSTTVSQPRNLVVFNNKLQWVGRRLHTLHQRRLIPEDFYAEHNHA